MTDPIIHKSIKLPALGFDLPCDGSEDVCEAFTVWLRDRVAARTVPLAVGNEAFVRLAAVVSPKILDALGVLFTDIYLTGANDALTDNLAEGIHIIPEDERRTEDDPMDFIRKVMANMLGMDPDSIHFHPGVADDLNAIGGFGDNLKVEGVVELSGDETKGDDNAGPDAAES